MLLRPKNLPEVSGSGRELRFLVLLRLIPLTLASNAIAAGSDVYFFRIGMMPLSALARDNGVFDWVASASVQASKKSCGRLFALIYCVGTIVTI